MDAERLDLGGLLLLLPFAIGATRPTPLQDVFISLVTQLRLQPSCVSTSATAPSSFIPRMVWFGPPAGKWETPLWVLEPCSLFCVCSILIYHDIWGCILPCDLVSLSVRPLGGVPGSVLVAGVTGIDTFERDVKDYQAGQLDLPETRVLQDGCW